MFILSNDAIESIKANPILVAKLRIALNGMSEQSIYRFYTQNKVNNDLTLWAALEVIKEETHLSFEKIVKRVEGSAGKLKKKRHSLQS